MKSKKVKNQKRTAKKKTQKTALGRNGEHRVKRSAFGRMKRVLGMLQDGRYPNCSTIAEEIEVSLKTVARDIEYMQDMLDVPIEYDQQRHGYYLTRPVDRFPMVQVTERELFYLCVVHKAIEHYRGTPLERPLELAFKKFAGRLDDEDQFTLDCLDDVLSVRPFAPDDVDLKHFEIVTQGITERRMMEFSYRKPGEKVSNPRRVHPYHMLEFGSRWYLIGYDLDRKKVQKFVLGRMREAVLTGEKFKDRKDFDPKKYFDGSVGVVTGESDYDVVIEMDAWLTDVLRGRKFHPKQIWTELPGGGSYLKLRLNNLEEIEHHVLSWGTHATVIGPVELRERLRKIAEELVKRYAGSTGGNGENGEAK